MKRFVCVQEEDISILSEEEITQQLLQGTMFDEIFELGRSMELQIRLVPAKKEKTKAEPTQAANGAAKKPKKSKKSAQMEAVN